MEYFIHLITEGLKLLEKGLGGANFTLFEVLDKQGVYLKPVIGDLEKDLQIIVQKSLARSV